MEKVSNERRVYESVDDIRAYLGLYLKNRRKTLSLTLSIIYFIATFTNSHLKGEAKSFIYIYIL